MKGHAHQRRAARSSKQRGFTMVTAIFLITILFLLSAFMVGIRVYQEASVSLDTLATRAYAAARGGVEWGAYNSLRNNTCAASTSLTFINTLSAFTATVTCSRASYDEAGTTINMDTIVATACNQPAAGNCPATAAANYVERQITVMVAQ
jgi:MSHA biogenesis protein MshP